MEERRRRGRGGIEWRWGSGVRERTGRREGRGAADAPVAFLVSSSFFFVKAGYRLKTTSCLFLLSFFLCKKAGGSFELGSAHVHIH